MKIAFDAKRYYHNHRGLGNYSRDVVRLLRTYAPDCEIELLDRTGLGRSFMPVPNCDIYHGLSGELPFALHRHYRTVVTMHDTIFIRYPQLYSPTYRQLFAEKVRYACRVADLIIAISEQTKRDLITYFRADERKIRVVYQGCNNSFRLPVTPEQVRDAKDRYHLPDHYLLDVGAIEPRKNLKNLILACHEAHIDYPLVAIGGKSHYAQECARLAESLSVPLILRHDIPFADFPAIYKGAELMCYPSLFEGFGIPILEAMCVGIPVLTSTGSCFAETGGDAVLYADPHDPAAMGRQLDRILQDADLRREMIDRGYRQAALFEDKQVFHHLMQVYEELI